jgi:hypothetical protein
MTNIFKDIMKKEAAHTFETASFLLFVAAPRLNLALPDFVGLPPDGGTAPA